MSAVYLLLHSGTLLHPEKKKQETLFFKT